MRKIKVTYLLNCLATGGLERMVNLLATGLDPERFEPSIEIFDRVGPIAAETRGAGIPVRFDRRNPGPFDVRFLFRLAERFRTERPDVIHAHNATALVYAAFAARIATRGRRKIPVLYTEHDRSFPSRLANRAMHFAAGRLVDRVVVVARWLKASLVRYEAFAKDRIEVIPNGIDGSRFETPVDALAVRSALGIEPAAPVVSCVARLVPVKNHAMLLHAWRRIADVWPGATLLLAGDGPSRPALEALSSKLGLGSAVRFLGDRRDVPELVGASDFHVLSSDSEGMSLTLLEAMAAGKANVATDVGGNPEVLQDGRTGLLVPARDAHALAAAMATLLQSRAIAARMGEAAREAFRRRFTLTAMVGAYEQLYLDVLGERALPKPAETAEPIAAEA